MDKILKIIDEMILRETNKIDTNLYPTMHDHKREVLIELKSKVSRVELPVKPACDEQILQAKIDELENWIKYLNWNPTNIIHKSMLMDRIKILENENRKSV